ncbi:hypothetical protein CONLIGDRAFT_694062 [Coniochaeta ligniaria NRRL 30616]|uniref:Uncharacterized protein n=1 Tax=Coniochaeta ligniaria NRRL 30616 TaxID=1408157 RepID=A0A1J7J1S2_9PEZI|nr:hypothetical protein CONLIGDRAFT_694062 [Coniochaeta ligniaria NRRL 30616]
MGHGLDLTKGNIVDYIFSLRLRVLHANTCTKRRLPLPLPSTSSLNERNNARVPDQKALARPSTPQTSSRRRGHGSSLSTGSKGDANEEEFPTTSWSTSTVYRRHNTHSHGKGKSHEETVAKHKSYRDHDFNLTKDLVVGHIKEGVNVAEDPRQPTRRTDIEAIAQLYNRELHLSKGKVVDQIDKGVIEPSQGVDTLEAFTAGQARRMNKVGSVRLDGTSPNKDRRGRRQD